MRAFETKVKATLKGSQRGGIVSLCARISAQSSLTQALAVPTRGAACAICLVAPAKIEPGQVLPVASPMAKAKT